MRFLICNVVLIFLFSFNGAVLAESSNLDDIESSIEEIQSTEVIVKDTNTKGAIKTERSELINRIKSETINFDPDKVAEHLEKKGVELLGIAQSVSVFQLSFASLIFLVLLFAGIFFKALRKVAFTLLFLTCIGFALVNYWPEILSIGRGFFNWLTSIGGAENADTSGI